jgi:Ca2+-binding RTX toxin-like protein
VLIGGPGNDVIDGGDGDDIEIESFGADTVTSATTAGEDWLAANARVVKGKTVLKVGGKERKLPRADLSELVRGATSA